MTNTSQSRLEALREKLRKQEENKGTGNRFVSDNALYRFWDMPENATASVRFLDDVDSDRLEFWVERHMIHLPFDGIKGQPSRSDGKPVIVSVPAMSMYGETDPIAEEIRPWWKDEELKKEASKYWRKLSFLYQGIVRGTSPVKEEETPANPIRRFNINQGLHEIIRMGLTDEEILNHPADRDKGLDFNIRKTKGAYGASYTTSSYARRESGLSDAEKAAIAEHGLFNLNEYIPAKPTEKQLQAIMDMFEASVDGAAYDPDRFGEFYRPHGVNKPNAADNNNSAAEEAPKKTTVAVSKPASVKETVVEDADEAPFDVAETPVAAPPVAEEAPKVSASDMLAKLRAKRESNG